MAYSPVLVALVTGLFGAIIAPLVTYAFTRDPESHVDSPQEGRNHRRRLIAALGGAITGLAVGYYGLWPVIVAPHPPPRIAIDSPAPNAKVPAVTTVTGSARDVASDLNLWLLVLPAGTDRYHPQQGPIRISEDGRWSGSVYLGRSNATDIGLSFTIHVVLADKPASAALTEYLDRAAKDGQYAGLPTLPETAQPAAQVTVVRQ